MIINELRKYFGAFLGFRPKNRHIKMRKGVYITRARGLFRLSTRPRFLTEFSCILETRWLNKEEKQTKKSGRNCPSVVKGPLLGPKRVTFTT